MIERDINDALAISYGDLAGICAKESNLQRVMNYAARA